MEQLGHAASNQITGSIFNSIVFKVFGWPVFVFVIFPLAAFIGWMFGVGILYLIYSCFVSSSTALLLAHVTYWTPFFAAMYVIGRRIPWVQRMLGSIGNETQQAAGDGRVLESRGGERNDQATTGTNEPARLVLYGENGCAIPAKYEHHGVLVMGSPGTGKTVLFNQLLYGFLGGVDPRPVQQKIVIHDYKGDFSSRLADREDCVLVSLFDRRGEKWCPVLDIIESAAIHPEIGYKTTARVLCPEPTHGGDPMWSQGAQEIIIAVLYYLEWVHEQRPSAHLNGVLQELVGLTAGELLTVLKNSPKSVPHLAQLAGAETGDKTSMSFFQTANVALKQIAAPLKEDGDFSLLGALRDPSVGIIILQNYPRFREAMKTVQALAIELILLELISKEDVDLNAAQQPVDEVVLLLDEFHQVGKVPSLQSFVTNYRSKGAAPYIAVQGWGSMRDIYGNNLTREISNCFNSLISYRVNDPDDAEFLSRAFGEAEVIEERASRQDLAIKRSYSEQVRTKRLVTSGEILSAPNLQYYCKMPGAGVSMHDIDYYSLEKTGAAFDLDREAVSAYSEIAELVPNRDLEPVEEEHDDTKATGVPISVVDPGSPVLGTEGRGDV